MKNSIKIRRAIISVSDKSFIEEFARGLHQNGVELIATGGTAAALKRGGIPFRSIEEWAGTPEILDGRIKTLTFKVQGGILYDRQNPKHIQEAKENGIEPIDAVICNFYPFESEVEKTNEDPTTLPPHLIEKVDIGGPTMIRSAGKNYLNVCAITDPADYEKILVELNTYSCEISLETRKYLMVKAFQHVHEYDQAIAEAFARNTLRYGENPHQRSYFVTEKRSMLDWGSSLEESQVRNFELSYNNILDAHAAFGAMLDVSHLAPKGHGACAIVKHNNPCGLATAPSMADAFERAWSGDPISSFGGVVAFSAQVTMECLQLFKKKFIEVLIAPGFEEGVLETLMRDKKKLRFIKIKPGFLDIAKGDRWTRTRVEGGTLVQSIDGFIHEEFESKTKIKYPKELYGLSRFGIAAAKWLKSNAISVVYLNKDGGYQLVGAGSGQPNRVDAIRRLAMPKALEILKPYQDAFERSVVVSDAFFPFPDSIEEIANSGFKYVIEPGGSIKDNEVISKADELGISMAFTGKRHFKH